MDDKNLDCCIFLVEILVLVVLFPRESVHYSTSYTMILVVLVMMNNQVDLHRQSNRTRVRLVMYQLLEKSYSNNDDIENWNCSDMKIPYCYLVAFDWN